MRAGRPDPAVFVVAAGGVRHAGGTGRLVRATVGYWQTAQLQPAVRVLDPYGLRLSAMTPLYWLRALASIACSAARGRVALLHVHMGSRGSAVRKGIIVRLAARLGVPVILHLHGSRWDDIHARLPAWARRWLRRTLEAADRVIVPGTYWRQVVVDRIGIDPAVVHVVANAVAGPAMVAPRPGGPRCALLFLGSLTPRKGLPELLETLARPEMAVLPWHLRVAGAGDVRTYRERSAALGIADRVEFLGWVEENGVRELLCDADAFVLPSHNEGLSVAMLEAMAHGCAVVATPVGATLDAITDGDTGLVVPVGDPGRLAAALGRVITDADLRARLQAAARRRWHERFQIADHCRRLQALYRDVCPGLALGGLAGGSSAFETENAPPRVRS